MATHEHHVNRCDIIDVLEEAVTTHGTVNVEAAGGESFTDRVRDVVTHDGEDFAEFEHHGRIPVSNIRDCVRVPRADTSASLR